MRLVLLVIVVAIAAAAYSFWPSAQPDPVAEAEVPVAETVEAAPAPQAPAAPSAEAPIANAAPAGAPRVEEGRLKQARDLVRDKRPEAAMALLEEMISANPKDDRALEELGTLQAQTPGQTEKAAETLRRAIDANPENGSARDELLSVYGALSLELTRKGDTRGAAGIYAKMIADQEDEMTRLKERGVKVPYLEEALTTSRVDYASALMNDKRHDEAESVLKSILEKDPRNEMAKSLLAALAKDRG